MIPLKFTDDNASTHECLRTCEWPPRPRTCRYEFTLEWYHTISTACFDCPFNVSDCYRPNCIAINGEKRAVSVVNRQFPGPSIQVCEWDTIEVKVENNLVGSEGVTIHWHGLHQRGTPHMDGTPLITQCPISFRSSFTYRFQALMPGTYFWHAHSILRADGIVGSLVIRQAAPRDIHSSLYDHDLPEHVIIMQDWVNQLYVERFARLAFHDIQQEPDSLLFNGRGRYFKFKGTYYNKTVYTPRHLIHVKQGERYRFRGISNTVMTCAFEVSIDGHNMTVIASDGAPVEPLEVGAFGITSGERYDFVLDAKADVGKYWMRLSGQDACKDMHELALVVYEGAEDHPDPEEEPDYSTRSGILLNPYNMKGTANILNINQLNATGQDSSKDTIPEADVVYYIALNKKLVINSSAVNEHSKPTIFGQLYAQLNHITFRPPSRPLLTQSHEILEHEFCNYESVMAHQERCTKQQCECTHTLQINMGQVVELVLVDDARTYAQAHPMHLHGYSYHVLAFDVLGNSTTIEKVIQLDKAGKIHRRTVNTPIKDTVNVPVGGYVVVRFVADNPGWWLFHCHSEPHLSAGMSMVIHVGTDNDLPPIPRDLPRCGGDWYPKDT
ncbi:laccase-25-like [Acanthaster planci]|uniref:Laccase-25-like n=1 Tax=Acanthaster planci TaxID=133434 RepID=A0A8B7YP81_ACAPL|nr:laccase-25-like [Acanthaster planci]